MGLSSSSSKQTTDQTQTNNQVTQGTQTPITPDWLMQGAQDYVGRIGEFGQMDPNQFVAAASPLQQMAWQNIGNLSDWQAQAGRATELAAAPQRTNTANPYLSAQTSLFAPQQVTGAGMTAPRLNGPAQGITTTLRAPQVSGTAQADATGYNAPGVREAWMVGPNGYNAPELANAQGYAASRVGTPIGASAAQANAATAYGGMANYQNPYQQAVIDSSLAQYDSDQGAAAARLAAQGAKSGAFGGSRFGIAEGEFAANNALGRATIGANLRDQGFKTALGASQFDAANQQQANLFNTGQINAANLFNADLEGKYRLSDAERADTAAAFGANANNQFGLARAGLLADAGRFNAQAANDAGFFNANTQNQRNLELAAQAERAGQFGAQAQNTASMFNAGATNDTNRYNTGLQADAGRFNADAANTMSLANANAANQFGLAQAGYDANAAQFNAQSANDLNRFNSGLMADYGLNAANLAQQNNQFNAGAQNNMAQFNAAQGDNADARNLQSAGLLADIANQYSGNTRADLQTMAQLGDQQRAIESEYTNAPVTQLGLMGQFSGMTPYDILVGQQMNGTSNSTGTLQGTQVTKSSPSLFDMAISAGQLGATFFSDPRLKANVEKVGELSDGLGIYDFDYVWGGRHRGVMADEVADLRPHALGPVIGGFATVNYEAL